MLSVVLKWGGGATPMDPDSDQDDHGSRENRRHQVIGHMTPLRSEASRSSHLATLSGGGGALMKGGPRWPEGARRRPPTSDGIPVMSQERSGVGGGKGTLKSGILPKGRGGSFRTTTAAQLGPEPEMFDQRRQPGGETNIMEILRVHESGGTPVPLQRNAAEVFRKIFYDFSR